MKHIITTVATRLQQQCNTLQYIDRNWGQLGYNENPPVKWPCALIDIPSVQYAQGLRGTQFATGTVDVTVAFLRLNPTSATAPKRNDTFDMMDLIDEVTEALHGYGTGGMQPLQRVSVRKDVATKGMEQYTISFSAAWTVKLVPDTAEVSPELNIAGGDTAEEETPGTSQGESE